MHFPVGIYDSSLIRKAQVRENSHCRIFWTVKPLSMTNFAWQSLAITTAQKMKFYITDFFSKCDQICRKLRIWSHLLKKSVMENFTFCAVCEPYHQFLQAKKSLYNKLTAPNIVKHSKMNLDVFAMTIKS